MKKYDFIFIVLAYRNFKDLEDFNDSLKNVNGSYKVILVESFFDAKTTEIFRNIAQKYQYDFLPIENKGYSYGNNYGIKFASENYNYKYLIVSNADIIVQNIDIDNIEKQEFDILGPKIIRKDGKNQNPMHVRKNFVNTHYINYVLNNYSKIKFMIYVLLYRFGNFIFKLFKNNNYVYSIHGSFIIFKYETLQKFEQKPFDENMFLFCEEGVIAEKCKKENLKIIYDKNTVVYHKEDGSMKMNKNVDFSEVLKKSYNYFYENYIKK